MRTTSGSIASSPLYSLARGVKSGFSGGIDDLTHVRTHADQNRHRPLADAVAAADDDNDNALPPSSPDRLRRADVHLPSCNGRVSANDVYSRGCISLTVGGVSHRGDADSRRLDERTAAARF